jgi:hypothetical protein
MPRSLLPERRNGAYLARNWKFESISLQRRVCGERGVRGCYPGGIYQYYKELAQNPQTARPEPLSVMAKRLGLLRW